VKVVGFCRVSTEDQRQNTSLESQEKDIKDYCRLHDLELVEVVKDAETGFGDTKNRASFVKAIGYLLRGEASALIVWKLDRYSRSVKDGLELFSYFETRKWDLISVRDQIDTSTPAGRAFFQIALVFAEWERNALVERVNLGLRAKRARGEFAGGSAPYGWQIVKGAIVLHPEESAILERMRRWHKAGETCVAIADRLNKEGIPSKRGKQWSDETVRRAIKGNQATLKSGRVKALT
jgi:site-specific DNA recombinase